MLGKSNVLMSPAIEISSPDMSTLKVHLTEVFSVEGGFVCSLLTATVRMGEVPTRLALLLSTRCLYQTCSQSSPRILIQVGEQPFSRSHILGQLLHVSPKHVSLCLCVCHVNMSICVM